MNKAIVFHYNRGVYPLRSTIKEHLFSFLNLKGFDVVYVNVAFGFPKGLLQRNLFSVAIFHTSFLGMRWSRELFSRRTKEVVDFFNFCSNKDIVKIAVPQDEFINTDILDQFLSDIKIDAVLSCASSEDWERIYPKTSKGNALFKTVLTGYIDRGKIQSIQRIAEETIRNIDIGYRAWRAHPSLGRWGRHKVEIANTFDKEAKDRNLVTDISLDDEDTFLGDDWHRFLASCRATIGVTGGSSVLDADGSIKNSIDTYLIENEYDYDAIYNKFVFKHDNSLSLSCISPRHLEACLTKTVQFLVEADYSGVLKPYEHYFPINENYSNLKDALDFLSKEKEVKEMVDRAYKRVTNDIDLTYGGFLLQVQEIILSSNKFEKDKRKTLSGFSFFILNVWDKFCWRFIRIECYILKIDNNSLVRKIYNRLYGVYQRFLK